MCITDNVECAFPCPEDDRFIPAWSLHRLIEMGFNSLALLEDADDEDEIFFMAYKNPFESMLEMFEWLIKEGYFNKEYLEEQYEDVDSKSRIGRLKVISN